MQVPSSPFIACLNSRTHFGGRLVEREHGRVFLPAEFPEIAEFFAEQIVAGDDDEVVVHVLRFEDIVDVADGAEFVGVVGGAVVDDGEFKLGFRGAVLFRPFFDGRRTWRW